MCVCVCVCMRACVCVCMQYVSRVVNFAELRLCPFPELIYSLRHYRSLLGTVWSGEGIVQLQSLMVCCEVTLYVASCNIVKLDSLE